MSKYQTNPANVFVHYWVHLNRVALQPIVQDKQTDTIWLVMDARVVYNPDLCTQNLYRRWFAMDARSVSWYPVHRIGDTVGTLSVSPRGIESPSLYWASSTVAAIDIGLGHLHRCLWGAQFSGSGLFLDCVRMLSRGWISSQRTKPCYAISFL